MISVANPENQTHSSQAYPTLPSAANTLEKYPVERSEIRKAADTSPHK